MRIKNKLFVAILGAMGITTVIVIAVLGVPTMVSVVSQFLALFEINVGTWHLHHGLIGLVIVMVMVTWFMKHGTFNVWVLALIVFGVLLMADDFYIYGDNPLSWFTGIFGIPI